MQPSLAPSLQQSIDAMPLGADSTDSPGRTPWDGVALAVILPKGTLAPRKQSPSMRDR